MQTSASTRTRKPLNPVKRKLGSGGHGTFETCASRVPWQPISDFIDWTDRSPLHSRRPSVEQVPALVARDVVQTIKDGSGTLRLVARYSGLDVLTCLKSKPLADGGYAVRVIWEVEPAVGNREIQRLTLQTRRWPVEGINGGVAHSLLCPHCTSSRRNLYWAVRTFACRECLGLRHESLRLGRLFTLEKRAAEIREKLGQPGGLMKPVIIAGRGGISPRRRKLAQRLFDLEGELLARIAD